MNKTKLSKWFEIYSSNISLWLFVFLLLPMIGWVSFQAWQGIPWWLLMIEMWGIVIMAFGLGSVVYSLVAKWLTGKGRLLFEGKQSLIEKQRSDYNTKRAYYYRIWLPIIRLFTSLVYKILPLIPGSMAIEWRLKIVIWMHQELIREMIEGTRYQYDLRFKVTEIDTNEEFYLVAVKVLETISEAKAKQTIKQRLAYGNTGAQDRITIQKRDEDYLVLIPVYWYGEATARK